MPDPDLFLFVSHVSEDRPAALEIVDELERRGVPCWIAPRDVRPGRPFDDEIADAIEACRAMLLIFSDRCNERDYIRREITVAGESHKVIIPFRIEDAQPRRGLLVRLADLHWVDGFVSRERAIDQVVREMTPQQVHDTLQTQVGNLDKDDEQAVDEIDPDGALRQEEEHRDIAFSPGPAPPRGKYAPLYHHLVKRTGKEWRARFVEVEEVLGFTLPNAARTHRPWWANQGEQGGHSHARAWKVAGWRTSQVDMANERLVFVRATPVKPRA